MNLQLTILSCVLLIVHVLEFVSSKRVRHKEWELRLIGGLGDHEGTVLVFHRHRWGSICDEDWDVNDASVVCKQLGYPGAEEAVHGSKFGRGRRRMWMSALQCTGNEDQIQDCTYVGKSQIHRKCRRPRRSAGVICQKKLATSNSVSTSASINNRMSTTMDKTTSTLMDKSSSESTLSSSSSSPSSSSSSSSVKASQGINDADVPSNTASVPATENTSEEDTSAATTTTSKSSTEKTLKEERKIKSVVNLVTSSADAHKYEILQADDPSLSNRKKLDIRMAGGRYPWEGRLEVREGSTGEWGVICSEDWTLRETMVACRQMRGDYGKQALKANYFGGENLNKIFKRIKCTGREARLDECELIRSENGVRCSRRILVAGVVCTGELPDLAPDLQRLQESLLLNDRHLYYLTCSMEENCLASSAYVIRNTSRAWRSETRRLLKFSTVVHNIGTADFRPFRSKSQWEWHSCHQHYHSMEVFAHYDIIDVNGNRLAEGNKASFCLEDTTCRLGTTPIYNCKGFRDQGLSVNCSDDYLNDIDCQWIDITDIKPGQYTFKMEINPSLLVAELTFDNNVAVCDLWYSGYNAQMSNCRYESLLPDTVP
ncbi:lysyl oxidase homolog 2A-like [Gigantopelta aegis]|uniref:lysyl oxidase homolog 2A-like n=1 Tax=Gigantopelta aegis TaxID=1735272 RepID=UPI001B88C329|nr:lysyl oxidase homolog 2A-like [Gigantopelta aegis]